MKSALRTVAVLILSASTTFHLSAPYMKARDVLLRTNEQRVQRYPIFGPLYEQVEILDSTLENSVFYIVSGHGGPDSGARGSRDGHTLCEDEYAYDIGLRTARLLLRRGARVHIIVRDSDDGIRSSEYLDCDTDEYVLGGHPIPLNQAKRLRQRVGIINNLHKRNKNARYARVLALHVDSRETGDRIDVFFYHHSGSSEGMRTAETLRGVIGEKYDTHQPWRGYHGTVNPRDALYLLKATTPITVYIELGNIRNANDQRRFILAENRQLVAEWLVQGLIRDAEGN